MRAEARRRAEACLRAHRLEAAYLVARLRSEARTRPLVHPLEARAIAIDRYFDREAEHAERAARALAERSALEEARAEGADVDLAPVHARIGALRADRARLDARLQAELQAFATTKKVLEIRLARVAA